VRNESLRSICKIGRIKGQDYDDLRNSFPEWDQYLIQEYKKWNLKCLCELDFFEKKRRRMSKNDESEKSIDADAAPNMEVDMDLLEV